MTPQQFAKKWKASTLKERSGAQQHFMDLCRLVEEQTPADVDPEGAWYCFERGVKKSGGGDGWADVWRRGCFAWEYKGKHKDLNAAFAQLQRYAIALENPPLLVVSDMEDIVIHTNFTNTVHETHSISLDDIHVSSNLDKLKWLFKDPERLRPGETTTGITEEAARRFAELAQILRGRGGEPQKVAHFLNRILFCLFAQDAGLLPPRLLIRLLEGGLKHPDRANNMLKSLFRAMAEKDSMFGADVIDWFNGGLFDSDEILTLEREDIGQILSVARLKWSSIEPSVFGTLFERGLDPNKRGQLGAHYTDPTSIMRIVQPVLVEPLNARWSSVKREIEACLARKTKTTKEAQSLFTGFLHELANFRVLDPACGSGNFLYLALQALKDMELRATLEAEQLGLEPEFTGTNVGVQCLHGIELNTYAAELARVTVWIGEIQWMLRHGIAPSKNPILKPLDTIECRDAILNDDGTEAPWPAAHAIIGNPPFLGNKRMLSELGEDYTHRLRQLFSGRLPGGVDLVTYWFERARAEIAAGRATNAGLVATQAIRKGANRKVLERIASQMPIFNAWRDEPWVLEGAAVRVSLVGFGGGGTPHVDDKPVDAIRPDLTPASKGFDLTQARPLPENRHICYMGTSKVGAFDIPSELAREWLKLPNPHGRPNSDVLRPLANGQDITGRYSDTWIIDFGTDMTEREAALYEAPFAHVRKHVKPERAAQRRDAYRSRWWIHAEARPGLRAALQHLERYIATPRLAKHRLFVWLPASVLADCQLFAICRDDDFTFGILSSRFHTVWALANSSRHGDGAEGGRPRYSAATCFETFPFPKADRTLRVPVAAAAKRVNELREKWLNPPEWVEYINEVVRGYPKRAVPKLGYEGELKARTMTNLYNVMPAWLVDAHEELDLAVARAYGWNDYSANVTDEQVLRRMLKVNFDRAALGEHTARLPATSKLTPQELVVVTKAEVSTDVPSVPAHGNVDSADAVIKPVRSSGHSASKKKPAA